jgi:uncharacterized protein (DUF1800 family)
MGKVGKEDNESTAEEIMELHSLGIDAKKKKANQNEKEELEGLVDNVKQSMIQDYKTAYSKNGDKHKDEAKSTANL